MATASTVSRPQRETAITRQGFLSMINPKIFVPPALILVLAVVIGVISPEAFGKGASAALSFTLKYFGWFYTMGASFLLLFCLWAGFSKYGHIQNERSIRTRKNAVGRIAGSHAR